MAVDAQGDVYIAEATAQRVQVVRPAGRARRYRGGHGPAGFNGDGLAATASELDEPTGVAVDAAGDLFIADTANCRVRVLPARSATLFGQAMTAGHLYTVAGTGVCGTAGQGGPSRRRSCGTRWPWPSTARATCSWPTAATSPCCWPRRRAGPSTARAVGAGDIGVVVGGTGSYGPYLADGLPATGPTAELNDPRGLAVGPTGALFVTDGFMHVIRVVPASAGTLLGRAMTAGDLYTVAGALPVETAAGLGDGTRWVLTTDGDAGRRRGRRRRAPSTTATPASTRCGSSEGRDMSRFGRRTFLASSAGVAAGAAAAGALPAGSPGVRRGGRASGRWHAWRRWPAARPAAGRRAHGQRAVDPVGVDPDGCSFAWTLHASGREPCSRRPTASWCGGPTRPTAASPGTAVRCRRPGRPSSPTRDRRSPPTRRTSGRSGTR